MPLRLSDKCPVCVRIKKDAKLKKRIWESRKFNKHDKGAEPISHIVQDYKFKSRSMDNHLASHQTLSPKQMTDNELNRIVKRSQATEVIENNQGRQDAEAVWDEVITLAREGIANGDIKLNANHLLKAAKDKTDYQIKKTGQKMQYLEMIAHFASGEYIGSTQYDRRAIEGETAANNDIAAITTGSAFEGAFRPDTVHNGDVGDAITPRASQVLEGDPF